MHDISGHGSFETTTPSQDDSLPEEAAGAGQGQCLNLDRVVRCIYL